MFFFILSIYTIFSYFYFFFFFFKQKTAYEMLRSLVGSEMCIRDRVSTQSTGGDFRQDGAGGGADPAGTPDPHGSSREPTPAGGMCDRNRGQHHVHRSGVASS
eukprot:TRINITY_DN24077_c0_g1_i10.p5 TRINITY_DN24077_c0_g1~~TRINITY_DN24077_c0_g1_i10.p5  ORF type:complete len:103 (-),score=39.87 TRINITY_DN24077_c0_g1_i10:1381-1689(-)